MPRAAWPACCTIWGMRRALKSAFGTGESRRERATDPPSVLTGVSSEAQPVHERSRGQQAWANDEGERQATVKDSPALEEPGTPTPTSVFGPPCLFQC